MKKNVVGIVYCKYDGNLVFMYKNGNASIEPIALHWDLEGKVPEVDAFAFDYVHEHQW